MQKAHLVIPSRALLHLRLNVKKEFVSNKLFFPYSIILLITIPNSQFPTYGFHLYPHFWHTFLGLPEPIKPVTIEKPRLTVEIAVEPHLGQ